MSKIVLSSFSWAHSYGKVKFFEQTTNIPRGEFANSSRVSEILKKSVIGYVEASLDGTKIRYISKENESQPEV